MYEYVAYVVKLVDGDTLHLQVDPGLDLRINLTVRLYGVNAPEKNTPEGKTAIAWANQWLLTNAPDGYLVVNTRKDKREKYGRYLGIIHANNGHCLNEDLVAAGQAVPYMVDR